MKLTKLFNDFFHSEKSGGIILIICTIISLVLANAALGPQYASIWNYEVGSHSVTHWINDGLMAIFFLLIGLELEREIYIGELSDIKNSLLPIIAALGGMLVPAGFHLMFNFGTDTQAGAGIPMATDIAFALGVLSLLGSRVPVSLKIFLTALAVIDDLGAILVIAIFYSGTISWMSLGIAIAIFIFLLILNRLRVHNLIPYLLAGVAMWYFMLHSGIHATITGVLLAFAIPFGNGDEKSPSYILQHVLHKPVAFFILPIFALANTSIAINAHWYQSLIHVNAYGIFVGLVFGKPIGISLFSYLSVKLKATQLPAGLTFKQIIGAGFLGGIGFTMSIFITLLAFNSGKFVEQSKIVVMLSSLIAGIIGFVILKVSLRPADSRM
ncbi:Na+/H+ antiporter NhaA [Pseudochryseolinea flava]|uniref:Na(+)/H(+) antiporter NhaA n=1 Tax=Pseudochryseolinea flava TaxID=2059302 RepID=A0A364Y3Q9_9BACT|nr:Na+/H+ antiporter NhaA [Pseudochryseolinea flava]RAW01552.1 Na+/H+ antiporter NhaA [Pseudochryseolinea flava]